MEGVTLKSRAVAFAFCVGATAFILALIALADPTPDAPGVFRAVAIAIVCAIMSWASAERALAGVAEAVDVATARIVEAAEGDLTSRTPSAVEEALPLLSGALDGMFAQVRENLESATTLALFDPITSLANRTHFRHEAERALKAVPTGGMSVLAFIDLDNFKAVNDTFGHASGDQALVMVANRLRAVAAGEVVRQSGAAGEPIVGRHAGDEFALFFPHVEGRDDAARLGGALLDALTKPFDIGGQQVTVGASIGLALSPEHGTMLTPLIRAADVAMYHAKASGRGQYQLFAELLAERMARRTLLEVELRHAIEHKEFTIAYQPQVALADGRVQAAEGLLRWNHPTDGLRLPANFIACAEESGLIHEIGDWAIDEIARRVAHWTDDPIAPRFAVNLSPRQITRPEFFTRLNGALARARTPLSLIEFEVSEAVLMECSPAVLDRIGQLRRDGATIAIDDFGSGLSSLARLRSLPFDTVKLDASLIAGMEGDQAARDVVQAVITLVHGLGAKAIAEGVETAGQYDMLRVMGCDAAQGYAIAPPMIEADYRVWAGRAADRMRA
ncbi:bifunctional diguanylate cyclase/phosphodiesterase [Sphingomonas sp. SUN039]|uniref:putative bifunctional diguanylate cyclase/phosphodiesterase n=1 Tax=Sphingomonas sp. SUN039 TaxID=2937787 RepID=UPI0021642617|nr:EAL domain-containing protein [Sphingomonas sp. SUN039]UVO53032.1 EAL domain-containing protein [Sphingomonas sp. SUN039]